MTDQKSSPSPVVHQPSPGMKLLLWILSLIVRLWQSTLRFQCEGDEIERLKAKGEPTIILMWHNQLFFTTEIQRRFRKKANPQYGLVSASKDGASLAYFMELLSVRPVRGSSSRRGMQAVRELLKVLRSGGDVGITMDGPRGPMYKAQPGGAMLAALSGSQIALLCCVPTKAWRLKSWDRFFLPVPFSVIKLKLISYPSYEALGVGKDRESIQRCLEMKLNELHEDKEYL